MASSSERSPPPFPDSEDQDLLESEEVGDQDSDEEGSDIFLGASNTSLIITDTTLPTNNQHSVVSNKLPSDKMDDPLSESASQSASKPSSEVLSEPLDDFVDLTSNEANSDVAAGGSVEEAGKGIIKMSLDEATDDFLDLLEDETESPATNTVPVSLPGVTKTGSKAEQEPKESSSVIDINSVEPAKNSAKLPPAMVDFLVDINSAPPAGVNKPSESSDLFGDDPDDWFQGPKQAKSVKQPLTGFFGDPDEDLFEPMAATSKKSATVVGEKRDKVVASKSGDISGPLNDNYPGEPSDIFTEEALIMAPIIVNTSTAKTNGVNSEEEADIFAEATVELSLDSPQNERKKNVKAKPAVSSLVAAANVSTSQSDAARELEEEEEAEDTFEINISITNPEKIGDGMNAYMAYKVSTQTTLQMFRNKSFTVRRRFSDFLGLYEKLSEKHAPGGFIVPPPPEKSILGMTKVKVGKEDPSSAEFVERRRAALERYLQRVVCHPSLLQDPDVREFLERDELPRAVNTQTLSGAGFLKMINKATDAVSKMTIKMNESDVWFEDKLQEVEAADQQFRKLLGLVESLVGHRKELSLNTAGFAKSIAMLGSSEDNTALSRALSQLAEVEDKMEQLHQEQASSDSFSFAELLADYIRLLGAVRASFDHRMKAWQRWQDAQTTLQKKRELEAKLLWANKPDKLQLAKDEITEWEAKVTQYERDFDRVSATVRKEVVRFEKVRTRNFKSHIVKYLETLLQCQQRLIKYWEAFLPEAKAIV